MWGETTESSVREKERGETSGISNRGAEHRVNRGRVAKYARNLLFGMQGRL